MRLKLLYAAFLLHFHAFGQVQRSQELYQKIENYYIQNADKVEAIAQAFKSTLGHDTSRSFSAYIKLSGDTFAFCNLDSTLSTNGCLLYSGKYYHISNGIPEKIKIKKNELGGTAFNLLKYIPASNANDIDQRFGTIQSYLKNKK